MYKPEQSVIDAMPALGYEDVKGVGHNERGEPCKCNQCGKPCRNMLGLRVHIQQQHMGIGKAFGPRGPYKRSGASAIVPAQPKQQPATVSFCPGCGCNIKAVTMAMKLTQ